MCQRILGQKKCDECGREYRDKRSLDRHVRKIMEMKLQRGFLVASAPRPLKTKTAWTNMSRIRTKRRKGQDSDPDPEPTPGTSNE